MKSAVEIKQTEQFEIHVEYGVSYEIWFMLKIIPSLYDEMFQVPSKFFSSKWSQPSLYKINTI